MSEIFGNTSERHYLPFHKQHVAILWEALKNLFFLDLQTSIHHSVQQNKNSLVFTLSGFTFF